MSNPLDEAMSQAEHSSAAQRYTVPVDLVRTRIRRRRRIRTGVVAGVAALVVTAIVTPGTLGRSFVQTQATGDWPGQFSACGKPVRDVLESAGDISLSVSLTAGPGREVELHTVTTGPDDADGGWSYGLQVYVTDDHGTVVGVGEGPFIPSLDELDSYGAASFTAAPFPLTDDKTVALASCTQYPSGEGSSTLRPGTYDLTVVQTVGYTVGDGSDGATPARTHTSVPVRVGTDGATSPVPATATPPSDEVFTCGGKPDVKGVKANGLALAADVPPVWAMGAPPRWSARVAVADGDEIWDSSDIVITFETSPSAEIALLDEEGAVVGFVLPRDHWGRRVEVTRDHPATLDGPSVLEYCGGAPLSGEYTAQPYLSVAAGSATSVDGVTAANLPAPFTALGTPTTMTIEP